MKKITTEQLAELVTVTSGILIAIVFGWSLSAKEPVTIAIGAIALLIIITFYVLLTLKRLKNDR